MATFAAIDLGAQSGRVAVGRFDGERLSVSEVHRFPNIPVRTRNTLNWDVLRLYQDVTDGLRAAAREAGRVDSVAADSWAVDFGLLDQNGRLLQNPVHYRDDRRARAVEGVLAEVPARDLYERTGIQLIPINTVFELGANGSRAESRPRAVCDSIRPCRYGLVGGAGAAGIARLRTRQENPAMTRPVSLGRLRDISKQRSIRRPLLVPLPIPGVEDAGDAVPTKVEWPVPE